MKCINPMLLISLFLALAAAAQNLSEPWAQWSLSDATKILNDSGWGKTVLRRGSQDVGGSSIPGYASAYSTVESMRVRLLSAQPIRLAVRRLSELDRSEIAQRRGHAVEGTSMFDFDQTIVVAVDLELRNLGYIMSGDFPDKEAPGMRSSETDFHLRVAMLEGYPELGQTYLQLKNGARVSLRQYLPISDDGFGAKFIFPRFVDGKPFIDAKAGQVTFHAGFQTPHDKYTIRVTFKVADLRYKGALEY